MPGERFDYILALDVIEHLAAPQDFLDELRALAARMGAQVILTTANIGFIIMRLSLLLGRFEYGKRGILEASLTQGCSLSVRCVARCERQDSRSTAQRVSSCRCPSSSAAQRFQGSRLRSIVSSSGCVQRSLASRS